MDGFLAKIGRPISIVQERDFQVATGAAVALWLAFPPIGWSFLAWIAPAGWVYLARKPSLVSGRPWRWLYVVGLIHWLFMVQWVRLPHWTAFFGWWVLAGYLAVYLPIFVLTTRHMIHIWRWPSVVAAPVVWVAIEFARGYAATGFSLSLLSHSQVAIPTLIQVADLGGAFGLSFVMVTVAAFLEVFMVRRQPGWWKPALFAGMSVAAVWGYGHRKISQSFSEKTIDEKPSAKIALIQGVYDTIFDNDPDRAQSRSDRAFADYIRLSEEALRREPDLDLIVWPESMFNKVGDVRYEEPFSVPESSLYSVDEVRQVERVVNANREIVAGRLSTRLLAGTESELFAGDNYQRFNAALLINPQGQILERYAKRHRVMFGEYVPLGNVFPWLYHLTPMHGGLTPGDRAVAFDVNGIQLAPFICFENTVPHLVRQQVHEIQDRGKRVDALVTITNDGWFWGSSLLDVHLACGVFRAVELSRPMLIAANTGLSAWIQADGQVATIQGKPLVGGGRVETVLINSLSPTSAGETFYYRIGDLPAMICCGAAVLAMTHGIFRRGAKKETKPPVCKAN